MTENRAPSTDAAMDDVRARVRRGAAERGSSRWAPRTTSASERDFAEVDALLRRALAHDDPHALLMPDLLADPWRPELSLELAGHRGGAPAAAILFVKRRVLLPLTRWLFEYTLENFRRQHRLNVALMACVQTLAAEHVRLRRRVDALESTSGARAPRPPPRRRDEARLRRPSLRSAGGRRIGGALPRHCQRLAERSRRDGAHELRDRLRHLA